MSTLKNRLNLVKLFGLAFILAGLTFVPVEANAQDAAWGQATENAPLGVDKAPLPEDQAFKVEAIANDEGALVRMTPAPGYYLYQERSSFTDGRGNRLKEQWPTGEIHDDPHFGPTKIHRSQIEVQLTGSSLTSIKVDFQGCQDKGICYPPMTRTIVLGAQSAVAVASNPNTLKADGAGTAAPVKPPSKPLEAGPAEDQKWASWLSDKSPWWAVGAFFLVGLGLSMTPCVLPMVPVVVGLVAPAHKKGHNSLFLVVYYVLAHSAVLALVGAIGGSMGGGAGLVQKLQTPLWLTIGASSFIILGAWQAGWIGHGWGGGVATRINRLMDNLPQGRVLGASALGAGSALILGPCVAPATAGALLYVANEGSVALGAVALFTMGIGMGAPMLLLAAGGGRLLPTAGPWMEQMTKIGAMGLLGVAALLLDRATGQQLPWLWLIAWILALSCLWIKPQFHTHFKAAAAVVALAAVGVSLRSESMPGATHEQGVAFETVSARDLVERLNAGQSVMLDLSADWCTSCITMEKTTFVDPGVVDASQKLVALRLNLDEIDQEEQAFLKERGLIGPPAVLFFGVDGTEKRSLRLVGPEAPGAFQSRLNRMID